MKNGILVLFFAFFSIAIKSQPSLLYLNKDVNHIYERALINEGISIHTSIKPYVLSGLKAHINLDSIHDRRQLAMPKLNRIGYLAQNNNSFFTGVLFDLVPGTDLLTNQNIMETAIGGIVNATFGQKVSVSFMYLSGNSSFPQYLDTIIQQHEVVPGYGYGHKTSSGHSYDELQGYISYAPFSFFNVQVGKGKNFLGDGHRSLLLSDYPASYPYVRLSTELWRFRYVNLYTQFNDAHGFNGISSSYVKKYGAFHYLSWNATKWLNVNLFEGIIWRATDSSGVRGYDINYLNPIVFYRPVEYSQGSPDNALMGVGFKIKPFRNQEIYGQLILDELLFSELISGKGWWGNKQGIQVGVKSYNFFGVNGLALQTEYNVVRPYTYSHGISLQNYSHYNQALAHPLGANFFESISLLRYQKNRFISTCRFHYIEQGLDTNGSNWGADIFMDYLTPKPRVYGNVVGQGVKSETILLGLNIAFVLIPSVNLIAETSLIYRSSIINKEREDNCIVSIGLRTAIGNKYYDF